MEYDSKLINVISLKPGSNDLEFLQHILKRPGLYVGCPRLDYIQMLYYGWSLERDKLPYWNI